MRHLPFAALSMMDNAVSTTPVQVFGFNEGKKVCIGEENDNLMDFSSAYETVEDLETDVVKKKKKKYKARKMKDLLKQSDPSSIPVMEPVHSEEIPKGELQQYKDECMTRKKKVGKISDPNCRTKYCPNTVFVSNLPQSCTNSQLEETFGHVGPIRHCFMVSRKGAGEHLGFGYVKFASMEDANRAVNLKNDFLIGNQNIIVKHARYRVPQEKRCSKKNPVVDVNEMPKKESNEGATNVLVKKQSSTLLASGMHLKAIKATMLLSGGLMDIENCSTRQRVARTVIFGGLLNLDMAEDVHQCASEVGTICSMIYPLPLEALYQCGLHQDGCKANASAVLYTSVKEARVSVRMLHQKEIMGGIVWARQLGGEGSKTKKWKLIVRNLPFKEKVGTIRDLFSSAGFVWDIYFPHNPETGLSKGFAFVKYTCKRDAEIAIQKFNGHMFGRRPIAVDWVVPKKIYSLALPEKGQQGSLLENDSNDDDDDDKDDDDDDKVDDDGNKDDCDGDKDDDDGDKDDDEDDDDDEQEDDDMHKSTCNEDDAKAVEFESSDGKIADEHEADFDKEFNIAERVANDLVSSSKTCLPEKSKRDAVPEAKHSEPDSRDLCRTIFISNLPFDADVHEIKQLFSFFGEVVSFVPVLHGLTKRPKGTGFMIFKGEESAIAAISAANGEASGMGISLRGRKLTVLKALDKKSAHDKENEGENHDKQDHRNLYLAKEGVIHEGTPSSQGVSTSDLLLRKRLQEMKKEKLQSPNFHVSRTRLVIYNVPKLMMEKQLRQLCYDAVISRATKEKPVIRQVKFLEKMKKGTVSRKDLCHGIAFVEFQEHQHAMVALRVLNNNPETFSPDRRPIVEFALDNIQTLKLREAKQKAQKKGEHGDFKKVKLQKKVTPVREKLLKRKSSTSECQNKKPEGDDRRRSDREKSRKRKSNAPEFRNKKPEADDDRSQPEREKSRKRKWSTQERRNEKPEGDDDQRRRTEGGKWRKRKSSAHLLKNGKQEIDDDRSRTDETKRRKRKSSAQECRNGKPEVDDDRSRTDESKRRKRKSSAPKCRNQNPKGDDDRQQPESGRKRKREHGGERRARNKVADESNNKNELWKKKGGRKNEVDDLDLLIERYKSKLSRHIA